MPNGTLGPIRPRFHLTVAGTVEGAADRLRTLTEQPERRLVSRTVGNHVDVTVARDERHRWSPCIHLEFTPSIERDDHVEVHGLLGPHPDVWTMFAFANLSVITIGCFGAMIGLAQMTLDRSPWAFWIVPGAGLVLGALYLASQAGQRLAADQTAVLRSLIEEAFGEGRTDLAGDPLRSRTVGD